MRTIIKIILIVFIASNESAFSTRFIKPSIHGKLSNDGTYIITLSKLTFFRSRLYNPKNLNDISRITKEIKKHTSQYLPDICQMLGIEYTSGLTIDSVVCYETLTKKPSPDSKKDSAQPNPNKYTLTLTQKNIIKPLYAKPSSTSDDRTDSVLGDIASYVLSQLPQISVEVSLQNISCCNKTVMYEFKKEVRELEDNKLPLFVNDALLNDSFEDSGGKFLNTASLKNTFSANHIMAKPTPEQKLNKNASPDTSITIH